MNKKIFIIIPTVLICFCALFIIFRFKFIPTKNPVTQNKNFITQNEDNMIIKPEQTPDNTEFISQMEVDLPIIKAGEIATEKSIYTDKNGQTVIIPKDFKVSSKEDEQTIKHGLVIIDSNENEFVWVSTLNTDFKRNDFWTSFYTNVLSESKWYGYWDDINNEKYINMKESVEIYSGFYISRYEVSKDNWNNPKSKKVTQESSDNIWVQISPQDITILCENIYKDNDTVQWFFPRGVNYDTVFQWLIDTNDKSESDIMIDSSSWGNYTNSSFTNGIRYWTAGMWEETKANNIYDLAGNYWEWTQERYWNDNYVMRGGGYNIMWMACNGDSYPASLRDPLPWNNHHPNVGFRIGLYIK